MVLSTGNATADGRPCTKCMNGFNSFRYRTYARLALAFLRGVPFDLKEFVNLLIDIRWEEVPMAFGDAICKVVKEGVDVRRSLSAEFRCLVVLTVGNAFGSCRRDTASPWFHTNWDIFYARLTQTLITNHDTAGLTHNPQPFKKSFDVMMQLVEGSMIYHTMGYLPYSTPIHALLVANERSHATHMRNGFVEMGGKPKNPEEHHHKPLRAPHRLLLECVAQCILSEHDRDVDTWERAFGFYAGSGSWRALAWRCRRKADQRPPHETHYNWKLEAAVSEAFKAPLFVSDADKEALAQLRETEQPPQPAQQPPDHKKRSKRAPPGGGSVGSLAHRRTTNRKIDKQGSRRKKRVVVSEDDLSSEEVRYYVSGGGGTERACVGATPVARAAAGFSPCRVRGTGPRCTSVLTEVLRSKDRALRTAVEQATQREWVEQDERTHVVIDANTAVPKAVP